MPNWCEGNIRFKGKIEDITRLIAEQFVAFERKQGGSIFDDEIEHSPEVIADKLMGKIYVDATKECGGYWSYWIRNSKRNFVGGGCSCIEGDIILMDEETGEVIVLFDEFNAAWSTQKEPYGTLAKQYNVDIHIVGYECGMQFRQAITADRDGNVEEEVSDFTEWEWESDFPLMGG